jgi:hypothetical protein
LGLVQVAKAAPSSEHSNVSPLAPVKTNLALVLVVAPDGPETMLGVGPLGAATA